MTKVSGRKQYLVSIILVCIIAGICSLFTPYVFGFEVVAFILLLTLSIIAMFFDILPVLLAALLSALIWDFFFLTPRFNFQVGNTEDKIMLSMYFVIVLVNAGLTNKIRKIEKEARVKEEKAQTLKLYNTLLNSLSHELRTPVSIIIGATDNLLTGSPRLSAEDKSSLIHEISEAALRLNLEVENLLNMSRLESGFLQPKKDWCDMNELVYGVLRRLDEQLKNHKVKVFIQENIALFKIDNGLLEQVLVNLINNAALYTAENSLIEISVAHVNNELNIIIEDSGNGFSDDEAARAFEKFYRLKNSKAGGTGLGLSIVKGFVEAHGGKVQLKKSIFGGAKFIIEIPADKDPVINVS